MKLWNESRLIKENKVSSKMCQNAFSEKQNKAIWKLYSSELRNETRLRKANRVSLKAARMQTLWRKRRNVASSKQARKEKTILHEGNTVTVKMCNNECW